MKNNTAIAIPLAAALLLSGAASVSAQVLDASVQANVNAKVEVQGNATSAAAKAAVRGNATSSAAKDNATTTGAKMSAEHRSAVASFVQKLLSVADRDGGIGSEVRAVAKSQNDSASTSAEAIAKVEAKGKLRTLLFGADYKNLGQLRSEMATTANNIAKLKNLLSRATSEEVKADLSAEIKALENFEAKIEAFVKAHESSFSLFGWFTKAFSK
ncbi:MAG TPA: hypothetical protein VD967_00115 [Candidatus Paceibacterota bacterium]|nr:hypothetical protein [Candidatus Paceibacterota bacterium]